MLKLRHAELFGQLKNQLAILHAQVILLPGYPAQVVGADSLWEKKNRPLFKELRELLETLCTGPRRCNYCEDSAADEIEHTYPKKFYPERAFSWQNYLFACGPCNGSNKRDQFAVFAPNGDVIEIKRGKHDAVLPPLTGDIVFIDPRIDDPFGMMELDPATGLFVPLGNPNDINYKRADYTITILGLNKRDYLSRARRNAYSSFVNCVAAYIREKNAHAPKADLDKRKHDLIDAPHQSVFAEIGRLASLGVLNEDYWHQASELWDIYAPF